MPNGKTQKIIIILFSAVLSFFPYDNLRAQQNKQYEPEISGISLITGHTYNPSDNISFVQAGFLKLFDYDQIWHHNAPENLKFKVEAAAGASFMDNNDVRLIANTGILALLYIDRLKTYRQKPYVEAGIGIIYTDYRVKGQDYRFNFNPQAGFGLEFKQKNNTISFIAARLHHLSNADTGETNRGQNSVVFMFGKYF